MTKAKLVPTVLWENPSCFASVSVHVVMLTTFHINFIIFIGIQSEVDEILDLIDRINFSLFHWTREPISWALIGHWIYIDQLQVIFSFNLLPHPNDWFLVPPQQTSAHAQPTRSFNSWTSFCFACDLKDTWVRKSQHAGYTHYRPTNEAGFNDTKINVSCLSTLCVAVL